MTLRIKELRHARGLSQKKLAELAGVPKSTLGEMENHMLLPKQEYLERIAKVLGVTADDLYK
ncbi:MAG: helix-turn-helix transcriptional regulator [Veillonellales bacterium]